MTDEPKIELKFKDTYSYPTNDELIEQMFVLEGKLDKILSFLSEYE